MSAHCQDLADLPLPLMSHEAVSETQALKDANRDRLSLNGVVQPPGSAQATLDALVGLVCCAALCFTVRLMLAVLFYLSLLCISRRVITRMMQTLPSTPH